LVVVAIIVVAQTQSVFIMVCGIFEIIISIASAAALYRLVLDVQVRREEAGRENTMFALSWACFCACVVACAVACAAVV
jgi:hypothetical protein